MGELGGSMGELGGPMGGLGGTMGELGGLAAQEVMKVGRGGCGGLWGAL